MQEYTGFGLTIDPLHQLTPVCPNIVLNEKFHNLTCEPRRFPLGKLCTEPIAHAGTCTIQIEIH